MLCDVRVRRAGHSADIVFKQARSRWRREIRRRFALVLGGFFALGFLAFLLPRYGEFAAGMVMGGTLGMAMWAWDQPPPFIERWRMGRDGERWTARELRRLKTDGWSSAHDLASRYGNIDHVVVGPAGVFLLNSKHLHGSFAIEEGVLACHHEALPFSDYALPKLERQLLGASRGLEDQLRPAVRRRVKVNPVIVLWAEFPTGHGMIGQVPVVRGDLLATWLRDQALTLAEKDRPTLLAAVNTLPPAT